MSQIQPNIRLQGSVVYAATPTLVDAAQFVPPDEPKKALWGDLLRVTAPTKARLWALHRLGSSGDGILLRCSYCPGFAFDPCSHTKAIRDAVSWLVGERSHPTVSLEGRTHINAYSKSGTELGKLLSNFAHTPFSVCDDGEFSSVEAYWYWLSAPADKRDALRPLHGAEAKQRGRELRGADWPRFPGFERKICQAIIEKTKATERIQALLAESGELPILHYYVSAGKPQMVDDGGWMWRMYDDIRRDGVAEVVAPSIPVGAQVGLFDTTSMNQIKLEGR